MSKGSGRRIRMMAPVILVGAAVVATTAFVIYFRHAGAYHELAQARAILAEAGNKAPAPPPLLTQVPSSPTESNTDSRPVDGGSIAQSRSSLSRLPEPARLLLSCLPRSSTSQPWFDEKTIASVSKEIDRLRERGRSTPDTEALDPKTHTQDELRAAACAQLRALTGIQRLRTLARTSEQPVNPAGFEFELLHCVHCALADSDPEEAVSAYVDTRRVISRSQTPYDISHRLDDLLPAILDLLPGRVPDAIASELLATLDEPVDLEKAKQQIRVEAAERVEYCARDRGWEWEKESAALSLFQIPIAALRTLVAPRKTAGLVDSVERALPLVDSPPYRVAATFHTLLASPPASAIETRRMLANVALLCRNHHSHIAMAAITRSVVALKQYKTDHGEYPETLDGLTPDPIPALPVDPMTAQPLRCTLDGDGFTITSPPGSDQTGYFDPIAWHATR